MSQALFDDVFAQRSSRSLAEEAAERYGSHAYHLCQVFEADFLVVVVSHVLLHFLHTSAFALRFDFCKRSGGQHNGVVGKREFIEQFQEADERMETWFFDGKVRQAGIDLHDGAHGKFDTALRIFQHGLDGTELILVEKCLREEFARKLNGDFVNIFRGAITLFPHVLQFVARNENQ